MKNYKASDICYILLVSVV